MSLKKRIFNYMWRHFKPSMNSLIRDKEGNIIPDVRIGNTTNLGNPENLNLAPNVFIGHYNSIDASNGITIGEGCQITNYISILTHSSHISIRLYGAEYRKHKDLIAYNIASVNISKYCFIGPHTVIMPGTKIGKGSIVSAYSYVKGEFEDFSIIAGNPAKKIGDTRELDKPYLEKHPELLKFYKNWAE